MASVQRSFKMNTEASPLDSVTLVTSANPSLVMSLKAKARVLLMR